MRHSLVVAVATLLALVGACHPDRQSRAPVTPQAETEYEEALSLRAEQWEPVDAFRDPTPLERTVTQRLTAALGSEIANDEAACIARETAAFFGRYRALPDEILAQWVAGFCGASAIPVATPWVELDASNGVPNPLGDWEAQTRTASCDWKVTCCATRTSCVPSLLAERRAWRPARATSRWNFPTST